MQTRIQVRGIVIEPAFSRRVAAAMHMAGADLSLSERGALAGACERAETFNALPAHWRLRILRIELTDREVAEHSHGRFPVGRLARRVRRGRTGGP